MDWKDYKPRGRKVNTREGYVLVYCPEHPNANKSGGKYIYEHRLVMSNYLKRPLKRHEIVHHINGDKSDNRIENLELYEGGGHTEKHMAELTPTAKYNLAAGLVRYAKAIRKPRDLVPCACGCGTMIENHDTKGRPRRYAHGHNTRGGWKQCQESIAQR